MTSLQGNYNTFFYIVRAAIYHEPLINRQSTTKTQPVPVEGETDAREGERESKR